MYYKLKPLYQTCMITAPADNPKIFMRPIISREEALRLIDEVPNIRAEAYHSRVLRTLTEHYEATLKEHDCTKLIEMTMSIYRKKKDMERQKRKFGAVDERFMKRAEDLLFGEFAAALNMAREDVPALLFAKVQID